MSHLERLLFILKLLTNKSRQSNIILITVELLKTQAKKKVYIFCIILYASSKLHEFFFLSLTLQFVLKVKQIPEQTVNASMHHTAY